MRNCVSASRFQEKRWQVLDVCGKVSMQGTESAANA